MELPRLYRLRIQPHSATLSPWHADTLFGHLCWEVFWQGGKNALEEFLVPFAENPPQPPFVFSDGFPDDLFPRPILPPQALDPVSQMARERTMDRAKKTQKIEWLTQVQFEAALRGERFEAEDAPAREISRLTLKNQTNRLTGTTGVDEEQEEATGRLYAVPELAFVRNGKPRAGATITFYLWVSDEVHSQIAVTWMNSLARSGYGKRKTVGYGRFEVLDCKPLALNVPDNANGIISLASFVPAARDPRDGYYRTRVKYGKLGEAATLPHLADSPFKFPLLMLSAGSTFYVNEPASRHFVGRLVRNIHPKDATIAQGAFAPAVPILLPAPPN